MRLVFLLVLVGCCLSLLSPSHAADVTHSSIADRLVGGEISYIAQAGIDVYEI